MNLDKIVVRLENIRPEYLGDQDIRRQAIIRMSQILVALHSKQGLLYKQKANSGKGLKYASKKALASSEKKHQNGESVAH